LTRRVWAVNASAVSPLNSLCAWAHVDRRYFQCLYFAQAD
jgi:hypothetical protein